MRAFPRSLFLVLLLAPLATAALGALVEVE